MKIWNTLKLQKNLNRRLSFVALGQPAAKVTCDKLAWLVPRSRHKRDGFFCSIPGGKKNKSALATQASWVQSVYGWNEQRTREQAIAKGLTLADRAGDSDEICSRVPYRQRVEDSAQFFLFLIFRIFR